MSIEQLIEANTQALRELTAALIATAQLNATYTVKAIPPADTSDKTESITATLSTTKELNTDPTMTAEESNAAEKVKVEPIDAKKAILNLSAKHGKPAALAVLKQFNVNKLTELSEDRWPEVAAAVAKKEAELSA